MAQAPKSVQQVLQELWELLKAYAQQETIGPIKRLGAQIGWGLVGTLSFALGYFLITLGALRFLQTQSPVWWRPHNWANYFVAGLMLAFGCYWWGYRALHRNLSAGPTPNEANRDDVSDLSEVSDLNGIVVIGEEPRA